MKSVTLLLALIVFGQPNPLNAQSATPQANQSPPTVRWTKGTLGSTHYYHDGIFVEVLSQNGVTVKVSAPGKLRGKFAFKIAVRNQGTEPLDVLPETFTLEVVVPKVRSLAYVPPERLINSISRRARISAGLANMAGATATKEPEPSRDATITLTDQDGNVTRGTYSENRPAQIGEHDAETDALYKKEAARIRSEAQDEMGQLNAVSLRAVTLNPTESISGLVYFEYEKEKKARQLLLKVPVAGTVFEFLWTAQSK